MGIAYLIDQGAIVSREGQRLLVKKQGALIHTIHSFNLEQLIIFGNVSLTPAVISHLLRQGIDTAFMTAQGRYLGRLQSPEGKNIPLRQLQYSRFNDPAFVLESAKAIVAGKLANQRGLLMRINRSREGENLEEMIYGIKKMIDKAAESKSLDELRGYEGKGSALFFKGFSRGFLQDGIRFESRVRRPPTDPVNALLSLGYTLLFNIFLATVYMVGLDPYFGMLHTTDYGRPSLALDLMEEWRPVIVDALVLSVFNLKSLTEKDFIAKAADPENEPVEEDGGEEKRAGTPVYLTESGMRKYLTQFERKMAQKIQFHLTGQEFSYRDCIREQVRHFIRYVKGEDATYCPIQMK